MTNETYEKLQAELSQLLNTEKYKRMTSKNKDVYKQAVLACKSVVSHYKENAEIKPVKHGRWIREEGMETGRERPFTYYYCSNCGKPSFGKSRTCPDCGAEMEE